MSWTHSSSRFGSFRRRWPRTQKILGKGIDTQYMNRVVAPLTAVVDAAAFSNVDKQNLWHWCKTDNQAMMMSMSCPAQWPRHTEATAQTSLMCSNVLLDKAQTELGDTRHS